MSTSLSLMIASSDEHFREMVRDNLLNVPDIQDRRGVSRRWRRTCTSACCRIWSAIRRRPDHRSLGRSRSGLQGAGASEAGRARSVRDRLATIIADGETVIAAHARRAPTNSCCSRSSAPSSATPWRASNARRKRAGAGGEQAGQGLHLPRHEGRRRHHHAGRQLRRGAGAAQAVHRADRSGLDRQRCRHAAGRCAAVHACWKWPRTEHAWIRRCSKAS